MGIIKHHSIVVCSWDKDLIEEANVIANDLFEWVSPISNETINGYMSFFIPPDGSKEGWKDSNIGDKKRNQFIKWLNTKKYPDGSSPIEWVEIIFGGDVDKPYITRSNKQNA